MPFVTVDGVRFFYQQAGAGPDVVLLHAVTSNLAVWVFSGLLDALAADFRVTAYDLRGHGHSDVTPTGYTSAEMAEDLHKLHKVFGLRPAYLVGHSFGAVVATHAAVLYPEMVAGLVLSDPYFPGLAHVEPNLGQSNVWLDLKNIFARAGIELSEEVDFTLLFRTVRDLAPNRLEKVKAELGPLSLGWLGQLPRLAETTCGADAFAVAGLTAEKLASVRQPLVALYDEHTPFTATRRHLAENLPTAKVDMVPGAKHVAPLQSSEDFTRLVRHHLRALVPEERRANQPCTSPRS